MQIFVITKHKAMTSLKLEVLKTVHQIINNDFVQLATQNGSFELLIMAIFVESKKRMSKFL